MATRVGVGFSELSSPRQAGSQATEQALEPLGTREANLVMVFSTTDLEPREVLLGVRALSGEVPLVGACSTGIIVPQGPLSTGVAVLALWSEEMRLLADIVTGVSRDPGEAGRALVRRLWARREETCPARGLLVALLSARESRATVMVTEAMGDELGSLCQLVGAGAEDPSRRIRRPIFFNGEAYGDAAGAALLLTRGPVGVGVRHGYKPVSRPLVVTRAHGDVLYELDGRSAFQAYIEQFPDHPELTVSNFGQFALDYPLGLPQMGREYIVRDPLGARPDGALDCAGVIPEHAVVRIMAGSRETLLSSARQATAEAMQQLGGGAPLLALVFSCVSRLAYLGSAAQEEGAVMREVVGSDTPLIRLFSFGEVAAQLDSPPMLHNKTVVVTIVGEA